MSFKHSLAPSGQTGIGYDLHKSPAGTDKIDVYLIDFHDALPTSSPYEVKYSKTAHE